MFVGPALLMLAGGWLSVGLWRSLQLPVDRAAVPVQGERFDPRGASVAEWTLVPGIGPSLAKRLHHTRPRGGAWSLSEISGIGPVTARSAAAHLMTTRGGFDASMPIVREGASSNPVRSKDGSP